jgi:hypothetical protein
VSAGKKRQVGNSPFKSEIREKFEFRNSKTEGKSKTETRKEFDHGLLGFHRFLGGRSQLKVAQNFILLTVQPGLMPR